MTTPANFKAILGEMTKRRIIAQDIADALHISRNAANDRMKAGIDAGDTIAIARHFNLNPVELLVELHHVTIKEVFDYMDSDGTLLATAPLEQVIFRLAEDGLGFQDKLRLVQAYGNVDELAQRRSNKANGGVEGVPYGAVADSSPDEDALREQEEGDAD